MCWNFSLVYQRAMWRFLTDDNTNMSYTPKFIKRNHKEIRTWSILTLLLSEKVVNIFYWVNYKQKIYKSQNILWSYYSIFVWVCHCHLSVDPILSEFQAHQLILGTEKRLGLIFGGLLTRFHTRISKLWIRVSFVILVCIWSVYFQPILTIFSFVFLM